MSDSGHPDGIDGAQQPVESIVYRRMSVDDIVQVHDLDRLSFTMPWPERSYKYELTENANSALWVAEAGFGDTHRVIAMIVVWLIVDEAHIGTLAVHPDYRRKGIARQLLAMALLDGIPRGMQTALLEVRRGNEPALALYRLFGFEVVSVRPRYYRDNNEDALLMTLKHLDSDKLQSLLVGRPASESEI
jgi:[ribosomal protein S18]-alanine N-acetyltransferase